MRHLFVLLLILIFKQGFSQNNYWQRIDYIAPRSENTERLIVPQKYLVFRFDFERFLGQSKSYDRNNNRQVVKVSFPLPDGNMENFNIKETPVFEPGLAQKYPGFTSYTGRGVENPNAYLKMSVSPYNISVMILYEDDQSVFIDPFTPGSSTEYVVYYKKDYKQKSTKTFKCGVGSTHDHDIKSIIPEIKYSEGERSVQAGDCLFKSYRLALACTGEYAQFHGGTVPLVLAAFNTAMTRVNGVYEKELSITMKLIDKTDTLIFLNSATDPYDNNDGPVMLGQNQSTINNRIGFNNYDIGHVFSTGGGGIASLGSPCTSRKAQGVTGLNRPIGDPFTIDYVAHEIGHQFGANHTFNNACGGNRNSTTAMEVGSGSTIMGYAGICDPSVQNLSSAYFHTTSLLEIGNFVTSGSGATCATIEGIDNSRPVVFVSKSAYTLPISTAFYLKADATDEDGDQMTYCWEQINNQIATMPPVSTNTTGPSFRSLPPNVSSTRYFPDLLRRYNQWEVLPSVSRQMRFRCTVRDNNISGGCTDETEVQLTFTNSSGPFVVTNPNTAQVNWKIGSEQPVLWNVAKTNESPVNCEFVDILLSIDGGSNYVDTLAVKVPNNGSYQIIVPNLPTTRARIMVVANDNIFFDVSNTNFRITSSFNLITQSNKIDICNQNSIIVPLELTKSVTNELTALLSATSLIDGLELNLSQNPVMIPGTTNLSINGLSNLELGDNIITITADINTEKIVIKLNLFKNLDTIPPPNTLFPAEQQTGVSRINIPFSWEPILGVTQYEVQISANPSFLINPITLKPAGNNVNFSLSNNTVFYWRVRAITNCGTGPYSSTQSFRTGVVIETATAETNILLINPGETAFLNSKNINVPSTLPQNVKLTITKLPENGILIINESDTVRIGSVITYLDILNDKLTYHHFSGEEEFDNFVFDLTDDFNRWLPNVVFKIRIRQQSLGIVSVIQQNVSCTGLNDGIIFADGFGGASPYLYALNDFAFQDNPLFKTLSPGSYTVKIKDTNDQIRESDPVIINEPTEISLVLFLENYDIKSVASGGTGLYTYQLNNNEITAEAIFEDPGNGQYDITVRDENGCSTSVSIEVDIEALSVSTVVNDILCADQKAVVIVNVEGGIAPFQYSVNDAPFQPSNTFELEAGSYYFNIQDAGGKIIQSSTIATNSPVPIQIEYFTNRYQVELNPSGGAGSYQYSLDGIVYASSDTIIFPENGTYTLYVKDENECIISETIEISVLTAIQVEAKNVSCFEKSDGTLTINAPFGTQPFLYRLNNGTFSDQNEWTALSSGLYHFEIQDAIGDIIIDSLEIFEPTKLNASLVIEDNTLIIVAEGGTPPYLYSLDNGVAFFTPNVFPELPDNTYQIVVKDFNDCIFTGIVVIKFTSTENETRKTGFKVFPNPGNGLFYFKSTDGLTLKGKLTIRNILGQNLYESDFTNKSGSGISETLIDLNLHPNGKYLLEYIDPTYAYRQILIIIK